MATIRLFANLRELAGTGKLELDVDTVGDALDRLVAEHGERFERGLGRARVWLNADPAERDMPVGADDEIAIIPPVSGGATPMLSDGVPIPAVAGAGMLLVVGIANAFESPALFIAALVGALAVWAVDIVGQSKIAGTGMNLAPVLLSILGGTSAGWWYVAKGGGASGMGVALVGGVIITLLLASFRKGSRSIIALTSTGVTSAYAATAGAGMAAIRLSEGGQLMIWLFLVMVAAGAAAAAGTRTIRTIAVLDPLVAGALGSILAGLVSALILDLHVVGFLFVAVLVSLTLIAGRALGSLGRTGQLYLAETQPGYLPAADGSVLAAAMYLFALTFFIS